LQTNICNIFIIMWGPKDRSCISISSLFMQYFKSLRTLRQCWDWTWTWTWTELGRDGTGLGQWICYILDNVQIYIYIFGTNESIIEWDIWIGHWTDIGRDLDGTWTWTWTGYWNFRWTLIFPNTALRNPEIEQLSYLNSTHQSRYRTILFVKFS